MRPTRVYVASSWRCIFQPLVVETLRAARIPCYDFKADEGAKFHWSEVGVDSGREEVKKYLDALDAPRSIAGFASDFGAMEDCDTFVLVLPCNRSAHLELGWAVGKGKRTAILLDPDADGKVQPELMYKMVDYIAPSLLDLLGWLGVED
jgi:nucleoside 2-deoxyribosyltransferase